MQKRWDLLRILKLITFLECTGSSTSQPVNCSSQQDLYVSLKNIHYGRTTPTLLRSRPPSPSPSLTSTRTTLPQQSQRRTCLTPPLIRRSAYNPSPAGYRRNWVQRHNRRPNTLNMDEESMKGEKRKILEKCNNIAP